MPHAGEIARVECVLLIYGLYFLRFFVAGEVLRMLVRLPGRPVTIACSAAFAFTAQVHFAAEETARACLLPVQASGGLATAAAAEVVSAAAFSAPVLIAAYCLPLAGRFVDVVRGVQFAEQVQPENGERISQLETAGGLLAIVVLFSARVHEVVLENLLTRPLAVGSADLAAVSGGAVQAAQEIDPGALARLAAGAIETGLLLSAPALLTVGLIDAAAIVAARMLGRINASFELLPLKAIAALVMVGVCLGARPDCIDALLRVAVRAAFDQVPPAEPRRTALETAVDVKR